MLRRGLMDKVGTQSEIDMLAATLYASAAQVNQMVVNTSSQEPAAVTNYESMWMISTANYYAGSGCIGTALQAIHDDALQLTWEQIIAHMDGDCEVSARYVQKIFSTDFNLSMCNRFDRLLQLVCHE